MKCRTPVELCLIVASVCTIQTAAARAATISVAAGGNLQQAINTAQPGDTIALERGATFTGNFVLPSKPGSDWITLRTAGGDGLPGDGERVSPAHDPLLARIRSANGLAAITTAAGAHHWRLMLLEFLANVNGAGDVVMLGDGSRAQSGAAQIPHDLVIDRVYLHGDPDKGQKRGISLNSAATVISGSYIDEIKAVGQDSQAICGWNGPGPFTITNNYLEAAGENVMFGGADPAVPNLVPADIVISDNWFTKKTAWRDQNWSVKNLIEFKNARRVTVTRNLFEYNWQGDQSGYAVLFTVRNQDGNCPWCQVDHVTFQQNVVRHTAAGIQILGTDNNHPSEQTQAIAIHDNVFADIDTVQWGGSGYFLGLSRGPRDLTIDHNTIIQEHAAGIAFADGAPILGFVFTNNLVKHGTYGIIGTNHSVGLDSISAYFPGSDITRNVIAGGSPARYPAGNSFPSVDQFETQFVSYTGGDFRLRVESPWRGAATDGFDLGARAGDTIGGRRPMELAPNPRERRGQ